MAKNRQAIPTPAELVILAVLWDRGPLTVPEIWEAVKAERRTGYTTILKQLQVMEDKGSVEADKKRRPYLYGAVVKEDRTQRRLVENLIDGPFRGSLQKLVLTALAHRPATREELEGIRELLEKMNPKK